MKACKHCGETKELSLFKKDNRAPDGVRNMCKSCASAYAKENRHSWKKERDWASYYNRNRPNKLAYANKRRAMKLNQTPDLTAEEQRQIEQLYWLAKDLKAVSGEDYHVDHIIPLARGGLHHPDNLQVLPADLNLKKGAKI